MVFDDMFESGNAHSVLSSVTVPVWLSKGCYPQGLASSSKKQQTDFTSIMFDDTP